MPKLWDDTIDAHRRAVRDATLDTTAALVAKHGLRAVTMSQIAEQTGIGRATLYKYFPDVESILLAWHERQIANHLEHLERLRHRPGDPVARIESVLEGYALIHYELAAHHRKHGHPGHGTEIVALLHHADHVAPAQQHLTEFMRQLLAEGVEAGVIRDDTPTEELASFCLRTLTAASNLPSKAAVRRLVAITMTGLRGGT